MEVELLPILFGLFLLSVVGLILSRFLKLPGVLGILLVGVIVRLSFDYFDFSFLPVNLVDGLAKVGIMFLLFLLGEEFSLRGLGEKWRLYLFLAFGQIILTIILGLGILKLVGLGTQIAMILSMSLAVSSTAVVVKLLEEKGKLQTVSGRTLIGWLLVQDLAVVPMFIFLSFLGGKVSVSHTGFIWWGLLIVVIGISFWLKKLIDYLAKKFAMETIVLLAAGLAIGMGLLFEKVGLSLALGGFWAGVMLSESNEKYEITAKLGSLRDLFAGVFFLSLGFSISLVAVANYWRLVMLLVFVFGLIKVGVSLAGLLWWKIHPRVALTVAIYLFEAGEFALILGQEANSKGLLSSDYLSVLIAVVVISMLILPVLLLFEEKLYFCLRRVWRGKEENLMDLELGNDNFSSGVVLLGFGRVGSFVGEKLFRSGRGLVVVDYDLNVVEKLKRRGVKAIYGDALEMEVLKAAGVGQAKVMVIAVPEAKLVKKIIEMAKKINPGIKILARAHRRSEMKEFVSSGARKCVLVEESVGRLMHGYVKKFLRSK